MPDRQHPHTPTPSHPYTLTHPHTLTPPHPHSLKKEEYQSIINQLPDVDEPSLFGLPPNIERVVQQANSAKITSQLKTMATADVAASGWDRERMALQLDPVLRLWAALTGGNPVLKAGKGLGKAGGGEMPVDNFIAMEAENAVAVNASP